MKEVRVHGLVCDAPVGAPAFEDICLASVMLGMRIVVKVAVFFASGFGLGPGLELAEVQGKKFFGHAALGDLAQAQTLRVGLAYDTVEQ
jgi:hypothetical protein